MERKKRGMKMKSHDQLMSWEGKCRELYMDSRRAENDISCLLLTSTAVNKEN
jgi:hypothetical protein